MRKISLIFVLFIFLISSLASAYPEDWSDDLRLTYGSLGAGFEIRDFYVDDSGNYCFIYWDGGQDQMKYTMINNTRCTVIDGVSFFKLSEFSNFYGNFYSFLHDENTIFVFGDVRKRHPSETEICLIALDYSGNITIPLTFISEDDGRDSIYPMVDFDDDGNILCFWFDAKGSEREGGGWDERSLFYARLSKNGTILTQPTKVMSLTYIENNWESPIRSSYIFDKDHNLYFFWVRETSTRDYINCSLIKILSDGIFSSEKKLLDYDLILEPTASMDIGSNGKIHLFTCGKLDLTPENLPTHRDFFNYYIFDENLNEVYSNKDITFYDDGYYWSTEICDSKIKDNVFYIVLQSTFETYNELDYNPELYEIKYYENTQIEPTFARLSELDGSQSKEPKLYGYNDELFLVWSDNKHSSDTLNEHEIYMKTTGNLSFSQVTYPSETEDENDSMFEPETSDDNKGEGNGTPGFEMFLVIVTTAFVLLWKRRR